MVDSFDVWQKHDIICVRTCMHMHKPCCWTRVALNVANIWYDPLFQLVWTIIMLCLQTTWNVDIVVEQTTKSTDQSGWRSMYTHESIHTPNQQQQYCVYSYIHSPILKWITTCASDIIDTIPLNCVKADNVCSVNSPIMLCWHAHTHQCSVACVYYKQHILSSSSPH